MLCLAFSCKEPGGEVVENVDFDREKAAADIAWINANMDAVDALRGNVTTVDSVFETSTGYRIVLAKKSYSIVTDENVPYAVPVLIREKDGNISYSVDGSNSWLQEEGAFAELGVNEKAVWSFDYMGFESKELTNLAGATIKYGQLRDPKAISYSAFKSIEYLGSDGKITFNLADGISFTKKAPYEYKPAVDGNPWDAFGTEDNILPDFSYAGYHRGEIAPPDVSTLGYRTFNICDYGAVPNDGKNDRAALVALFKAAFPTMASTEDGMPGTVRPEGNIIVYFPEGEFILHDAVDNAANGGITQTLHIMCGHMVFKGAGREKTRIVMDYPGYFTINPESTDTMYAGIPMITIGKSHSAFYPGINATMTADAVRGDYSVTVDDAGRFEEGDWVRIESVIKDRDYVVGIMDGMPKISNWTQWSIFSSGLNISEMHQIEKIEGNTLYFYDTLLEDLPGARFPISVRGVLPLEEVGVEDICFVGHSPDPYKHHRSWLDDSGYCILTMQYLVNSWVRRCNFESVVEGVTFTNSANCSAYDLKFTGKRGHNATRSSRSSRILQAAISDATSGAVDCTTANYKAGEQIQWSGCLHTAGVNAESRGAVLWRNKWGYDSTFECHASQPSCTLVDCCTGPFILHKFGGSSEALPHHLGDMVIWNQTLPIQLDFKDWWSGNVFVVKPMVVGMHGSGTNSSHFTNESQMKLNYSYGTAVEPGSLYEAQLERRLGAVPAWLQELKSAVK